MGCSTDTGCPFEESCLIPFAVQLVVDRHVFRDRGILSTASIKAFMAEMCIRDREERVLIDVKGLRNRNEAQELGYKYWRL